MRGILRCCIFEVLKYSHRMTDVIFIIEIPIWIVSEVIRLLFDSTIGCFLENATIIVDINLLVGKWNY